MADIVSSLQSDIKEALKGGDALRKEVLRLLLTAVKQWQIDKGETADQATLVAIVEKMIKQRRESIKYYEQAQRQALKEQEEAEISILQGFMPSKMSEADIAAAIEDAIQASQGSGIKDMGKVMAALKGRLAGRADMAAVSTKVREKLSSGG